jgi:hypothetical protein
VLPCGWGLLERDGEELLLKMKPQWHDVPEEDRLAFFQRIALAATRAVNREHGAEFVPEAWAARDVPGPITDPH